LLFEKLHRSTEATGGKGLAYTTYDASSDVRLAQVRLWYERAVASKCLLFIAIDNELK